MDSRALDAALCSIPGRLRRAARSPAVQPGQEGGQNILLARLLALWVRFRPRPSYRGFHRGRAACMAGLAKNLRNFLGTGRRILLKRR